MRAQSFGGMGGGAGTSGGAGGGYGAKGSPPNAAGNPSGTIFDAGAGGDGADAPQGTHTPGAGSGGYGGFGGRSNFTGDRAAFGQATDYSGSQGEDGGPGSYTPASNAAVNLGGGGGGAGGYGAVVSGTGTFGTTAALQGAQGGTGGTATYTTNSAYGDAYGTYTGGNGGDGGAGISLGRGETFTVDASRGYGTIVGGTGGTGGEATLNGYGTRAVGYGGAGGVGGAGILLIGPTLGVADPGATSVIIDAKAKVTGGNGGTGGGGPDHDGASGQGGAGILLLNGGSVLNNGTIQGGTGGFGLNGDTPGAGGAGISATNGRIVNTGTITGGDAGATMSSAIVIIPGRRALASAGIAGGIGVTGSNLFVINAGTIQGGTGTAEAAPAVQFTGGTNTLELYASSKIVGASIAYSSADTLALGGPTNATFDVSQIGAAGSSANYQGFGAFEKVDGSTWTLTNTTAQTTPWTIAGGTLAISSDGNLGAAAGGLTFAGGTLETTASLTSARVVTLNGSGTIQTDTGVATFSGPFVDGSGVAGSLTKTGSGTLLLSGRSTYSGATTIDAGTLEIDGSITSADVVVNAGGTLAGTGTIGDPAINAGGTLAPGSAANPTGTLTIVGPLTFASGSTYQVNITPTANSRTDVTGTTTIGGGTVNVVVGSGNYGPARYTLLTASGGVTGRFAAVTTTTPFAFLTPMLNYDANDVYLTLTQTSGFPTAAQTPNQQAAAGALQTLPTTNPLYGAIQGQTAPGARQAFDATSGEGHASASTAAVLDARIISTAVLDRLWNIGGPSDDAYQVLQGFGQGPLPTLLRCYAPGDTVTREILSSYSVWAVGIGDFGHSGGNGNAASLERTLGGFIGGVDMPVYGPGAAVWRFGIAGGYTSDDLRVGSGRGTSGTFENVFGTLYGGVRAGAFDARFGASVGDNTTTLRRSVAFPGFFETESSRNGGLTVQGFGEIGYRFAFGRKVFEPVAGFTAVSVHQDGFQESGGLAALRGFGHDTNVQTSELGFRAEMLPIAGLPIVARLHLAWQHSFGDLDPASVLAFEAGGSPFQVTGAPIDRDAALVEVGADYRATGALTVGLNYVGTIGPRDEDHSIRGKAEYRF